MLALATGACQPTPRDEQSALARDSAGVTRQIPTSSGFHEFRDCPECPLMVELPPGEFVMGRGAPEKPDPGNPPPPAWMVEAQNPPTEVRIAYSFAIGKYEVTFREWDLCVDAGGCTYVPGDNGWGRGDRPVINLARPDVDQYVTWIGERTGQAYRLPSEAEWNTPREAARRQPVIGGTGSAPACSPVKAARAPMGTQEHNSRRVVPGQPVRAPRHNRERDGMGRRLLERHS